MRNCNPMSITNPTIASASAVSFERTVFANVDPRETVTIKSKSVPFCQRTLAGKTEEQDENEVTCGRADHCSNDGRPALEEDILPHRAPPDLTLMCLQIPDPGSAAVGLRCNSSAARGHADGPERINIIQSAAVPRRSVQRHSVPRSSSGSMDDPSMSRSVRVGLPEYQGSPGIERGPVLTSRRMEAHRP